MYTYAVGDEVMVDEENIKQSILCIYQGDQNGKAILTNQTPSGHYATITMPYDKLKPVLTITDANQWQIQKHTIRAINRILKQQPPDQQ